MQMTHNNACHLIVSESSHLKLVYYSQKWTLTSHYLHVQKIKPLLHLNCSVVSVGVAIEFRTATDILLTSPHSFHSPL